MSRHRIVGLALVIVGTLLGLIAVAGIVVSTGGGEQTPYEQGYDAGWRWAELACHKGGDAADEYLIAAWDDLTVAVYDNPRNDDGTDDGIKDYRDSLTWREYRACRD
ncbi:hypothetical protein LCGC14_2555690 [marine sediment metagenome]|uniref:Uncharacterized protein n=1 Tax=marine sediment metagenome TaxID=412755 RepID=A0A0F9ALH8_9ZZZZ